jgi:hypothetical protein
VGYEGESDTGLYNACGLEDVGEACAVINCVDIPMHFLCAFAVVCLQPKRFGDAYFKTFIDRPAAGEKKSEFFWVFLHAIGLSSTVGFLIHQKHARSNDMLRCVLDGAIREPLFFFHTQSHESMPRWTIDNSVLKERLQFTKRVFIVLLQHLASLAKKRPQSLRCARTHRDDDQVSHTTSARTHPHVPRLTIWS